VYILIVLLVPAIEAAWTRFGMRSFWALTAAAIVVDILYFVGDVRWIGFVNYLFVWGAISLLGYAWLDGPFSSRWMLLLCAALALAVLFSLVIGGPYPVSMVSDPDELVSNTTPPKITLIALAIVQGGVLFALQAAAQRWLAGRSVWTATVLINANVMTLFIWHLTATTLVVFGSYLAGGVGLHLEPGSPAWWWSRIPWVAANAIALAPLVLAFGRFERPRPVEVSQASPWRYVISALAIGGGLALLAGQGVGGYGPLGLNVWGLALAFTGMCLISRFAESSEDPA